MADCGLCRRGLGGRSYSSEDDNDEPCEEEEDPQQKEVGQMTGRLEDEREKRKKHQAFMMRIAASVTAGLPPREKAPMVEEWVVEDHNGDPLIMQLDREGAVHLENEIIPVARIGSFTNRTF